MSDFIHVLGCGDAFASGGRANTSFLVRNGNQNILLDCGTTTLLQLRKFGYNVKEITTVVITHFHGDHFGGLPALILEAEYGEGKGTSFNIVTPTGGKDRVINLMECTYPGNGDLIEKQKIEFHYFETGKEININSLKISGMPVVHAPLSIPHGVRLDAGDFIIAFSGDSIWCDNLSALSDGADIFILDCNYLKKGNPAHLDYETLQENLSKLNAGKIYLTHMGLDVINSTDVVLEKLQDGQIIPLSK